MTEYELVRAVLPNLERSWMGTHTLHAPNGQERTPVLRGLWSDTVDGTAPTRGASRRRAR